MAVDRPGQGTCVKKTLGTTPLREQLLTATVWIVRRRAA
jgi:hypothetical protein